MSDRKVFFGALLVGALMMGDVTTVRADGWGTDDPDTVVYGWIYDWGVTEGGSWSHPSMPDGVGACVFEPTGSAPYRGDYQFASYQDRTTTWYAYGKAGSDYMYTADTYYDITSPLYEVVCEWVDGEVGGLPSLSSARPPTNDNAIAHGDAGSPSSGSADAVWASPGGEVWGNGGGDWIFGSGHGDTLEGEDGNDTISGYYGDDLLAGGDDNDSIYAGPGNDVAYGEGDDDMLAGGPGDDILDGGSGSDEIFGDYEDGAGGNFGTDDACYGGIGTDTCNSSGYPYYCETRSCELPS